jgi:hypothetical protein
MRRSKSRWILSLATALPASAAVGCADEHSPGDHDEDDSAVAASEDGGPTHFPGVVIDPDAGGPTVFPGVLIQPDAATPTHPPGVVVRPDSGVPGHPPGLVLAPDAGYPINGLVVHPPDAGPGCVLLTGIIIAPRDGGSCPVFPGVIVHEQDAATGTEHPIGVIVRPPEAGL